MAYIYVNGYTYFVDRYIILKRFGLRRISLKVKIGVGDNNFFSQMEAIALAEIKMKHWGYL